MNGKESTRYNKSSLGTKGGRKRIKKRREKERKESLPTFHQWQLFPRKIRTAYNAGSHVRLKKLFF